MRLRIQTYNPLPDIKAWFIPDVYNAPTSVYDLKQALCLHFQALKARKFSGKDLILLLEDFELLNDSPFSAVRDGDLICVKLLPPLAQTVDGESNTMRHRKRKRSQSMIRGRSVSVKRKAIKRSEPSEGSDSESDTSSTTSSSSGSSTSTSSAFSSPPKSSTPQKTKQPIDNMTAPTNSASQIISLVPPGFGKPSTHSRNKRRRLKKGYENSATSLVDIPGPPKGSSETNQLPLGQRKSEPAPCAVDPESRNEDISDPSITTSNQVMMGSLRNKNKKKGFKQSMAGSIPRKIIFGVNNTTGPESQQLSSSVQDKLVDEHSTFSDPIQPRLIPPSEIQELGQLPSNMFVTSVDVESEMWNEHLPPLKKKGKKKEISNGGRNRATTDDSLKTTTQVSSSVGTASESSIPFNWDKAEELWSRYNDLEKFEQLAVGCLVACKALALNPQTFSPEILLKIARVIDIPNGTQTIVIRYLRRPGAGRGARAFGLSGAAIGFDDDAQVEDEEETIEWKDIPTMAWRLVAD